jgi:AcrR family transcriptional regulator
VGDLLERANIGRSTFYSHYFDKEDVLADLVKQQSVIINQRFSHREAGQHLLPSLEFFEHFQVHYPLLHVLLREHAGEETCSTPCGSPALSMIQGCVALQSFYYEQWSTRFRNVWKLARPYACRFSSFNRCTCPSTGP